MSTNPYKSLKGEGETKLVQKTKVRRKCERCGDPATWRIGFMLPNYRSNPASSGYRRDDCSWCSDLDVHCCDACRQKLRKAPPGYDPRSFSAWPLDKFPHMGLYWEENEVKS